MSTCDCTITDYCGAIPPGSDPDCANCNGRGCMDCALRYWHDTCEHTCPMCEPRKARR